MADIFEELIPRLVLNTETDADSPDNETTYDGIRKLFEGFIMSMIATGVSGTVTGISSGTLTDTGNFTTDQCNGWSLIMTSGDAVGNFYTIDDTTTNTLICTGDDLETDGVAIGDTYIVLYDFISNADGHDHDDVNSKAVGAIADNAVNQAALANDCVGTGEIKESTGNASSSLAPGTLADIAMQTHNFFPNLYCSVSDKMQIYANSTTGGDYAGRFAFKNTDGASARTYSAYWYYITSSDRPFIYLIRDKITGETISAWCCEDPPPGYWHLDKKPPDFKPPIVLIPEPLNIEDITIFDYPYYEFQYIMQKTIMDKLFIHEHIGKDYDYNKDKNLFVRKNLIEI